MEAIPQKTTEHAYKALTETFQGHFPLERGAPRFIGREAEYPVVDEAGDPADVRELLKALAASGDFEEKREPDGLLVELIHPKIRYSLEVGWGTIELIGPAAADLHEVKALQEAGMEQLLAITEPRGLKVLGYGIQPKARGGLELMSPKARYLLLHDAIGESWSSFTATASDQVHIDVCRDELPLVLNVGNALYPIILALFSNSPITGNTPSGAHSTRELSMGQIQHGSHRHGMTARPIESIQEWVELTARHAFLMMKREGNYSLPDVAQSFEAFMMAHPSTFDDFLMHDHYVWNCARARTAHGTVEFRSACQQPWSEHMVMSAFALGTVEAAQALHDFLQDALGPAYWQSLQGYSQEVLGEGLAAKEPCEGLIKGILDHIQVGLARREKGEEIYLQPLFKRWQTGHNPASSVLEVFAKGQLPALIEQVAIRPSPGER